MHLRHPGSNLPSGDEELARLIAKLTVDANRIEATPAKLELEALQLDLHRLERHISQARLSGTTRVSALAVERQKVLDMIAATGAQRTGQISGLASRRVVTTMRAAAFGGSSIGRALDC